MWPQDNSSPDSRHSGFSDRRGAVHSTSKWNRLEGARFSDVGGSARPERAGSSPPGGTAKSPGSPLAAGTGCSSGGRSKVPSIFGRAAGRHCWGQRLGSARWPPQSWPRSQTCCPLLRDKKESQLKSESAWQEPCLRLCVCARPLARH